MQAHITHVHVYHTSWHWKAPCAT